MARRTRGSEIMIIPGATHYAPLEYPEMVNLRLGEVLARARVRGGAPQRRLTGFCRAASDLDIR